MAAVWSKLRIPDGKFHQGCGPDRDNDVIKFTSFGQVEAFTKIAFARR
jgi:hypothetical protein